MKILVISPHPDDETLGAGGTLLRKKQEGHEIYWLLITNVTEGGMWSKEFVKKRNEQIDRIISKYAFSEWRSLEYMPSSLDGIDRQQLIARIGQFIDEIEPEWILLPNPEDAHSDHKNVYEAAMSCTKIFRYPFVKKVTVMEILSETEFNKYGVAFSPNYFVDITDYIDEKINLLHNFESELGTAPFPRSVEAVKALATFRGVSAGCKYAEAFRIVKWID